MSVCNPHDISMILPRTKDVISYKAQIITVVYCYNRHLQISPCNRGSHHIVLTLSKIFKWSLTSKLYAEVYGLKFDELKSELLPFKPINFKMNPRMNICLNGAHISVETSCRYLGHIIANYLNDNEDIRRQLRCFMEGLSCCYVPLELVHVQWNCFCLCYVLLWKSVHLQHLV